MQIIWATIEYLVAFLVIIIKQNQDIYEVKDEKCERKKGKRNTLGAILSLQVIKPAKKGKVKCLKKRQKKRIVPMHVRCRVQSNLSFLCLVEKLTLPKNDPTSDFPKKSRLFQFSDDSLLAS